MCFDVGVRALVGVVVDVLVGDAGDVSQQWRDRYEALGVASYS